MKKALDCGEVKNKALLSLPNDKTLGYVKAYLYQIRRPGSGEEKEARKTKNVTGGLR